MMLKFRGLQEFVFILINGDGFMHTYIYTHIDIHSIINSSLTGLLILAETLKKPSGG